MRTFAYLALLVGCKGFIQHSAASTTADILAQAQPALQQESDYELAARAIPGALKTVEGFYVADEQPALREILTEGYCQYANAFVEDEWELAKFDKRRADEAYHNKRATKMYERCLNYALVDMPAGFEKDLFGPLDAAKQRIAAIGIHNRTPLMWVGVGLGGVMNHNLDNPDAIAYQEVVQAILERVVALDAQHPPKSCDAGCTVRLALPHVALGMIASAKGAALGGDPKKAADEFAAALKITSDAQHPDGRLLLARVLLGLRVGQMTNDRKLFHDSLVKVVDTDPAIWPEQRLANEVAHRKARRYLAHEKELFQ